MPSKKKIDALIYFDTDAKPIQDFILKPLGLSYKVLNPKLIFNIRIFFNFIINLKHLQLFYCTKKIKTKLITIIHLSIIDYYNPSIIITILDDEVILRNMACIDNKRKYFFIQNGVRGPNIPESVWPKTVFNNSHTKKINYFSYGEYEKNLKILNNSQYNIIPSGSFRASIFDQYTDLPTEEFDLCIISNYYEMSNIPIGREIYQYDMINNFTAIWKKLIQHIKTYLMTNNINTIVCLRQNGDVNHYEYKFFEEHIGDYVKIIKRNNYDTYHYAKASNVILSIGCSTLKECAGWFKKILSVDYSPNKEFSYPYVGGFWQLVDDSYDAFHNSLDYIFNLDDIKYKKDFQAWASQCNWQASKGSVPTYEKIKNEIKTHLE